MKIELPTNITHFQVSPPNGINMPLEAGAIVKDLIISTDSYVFDYK